MGEIAVDDGEKFSHRQLSLPRIRFWIWNPPSSQMVFSDATMCVTSLPSENGSSRRSWATTRPEASSIWEME